MERNKLFVKGLPKSATKETLQELFGKFGQLKDVRIVTYRNGHSKGIAYIDFLNANEASKAILKLDSYVIEGYTISVAISEPPARKQLEPVSVSKSLGGGGGSGQPLGPRGRGRSQLSFVPSVLKKPSTTLSSNNGGSNGTNPKSMSNADFKNMLLSGKK